MPPANIADLKTALAQAQGQAPGGQQMPGVDPMADPMAAGPDPVADLMARLDVLEGALIDNGYLDPQDLQPIDPMAPMQEPAPPEAPPDVAASQQGASPPPMY